jgi:hypothetical protein
MVRSAADSSTAWPGKSPLSDHEARTRGADTPAGAVCQLERSGSARTSPSRALHGFTDPSPFRRGQPSHEAFDRVDQDSPLRLRLDDAERVQLRLDGRRDPKADLWIILDSLARIGSRRRPARPASLLIALGHSARRPAVQDQRGPRAAMRPAAIARTSAVLVVPTIHGYNSFTWSGSASALRLANTEENGPAGVLSCTAMHGPRCRSCYLIDRSSDLMPLPTSSGGKPATR